MCGVLLSLCYAECPLEKICGRKDKLIVAVMMPVIAANDPLFRSIRGKAMQFEDSIKAN